MQSGEQLSGGLMLCAIALIAAFVALLIFRKRIGFIASLQDSATKGRIFRAIYVAACIPCAFLLIEIPYNTAIPLMSFLYVSLNLFIIGMALLTVFFAAQRSRVALGAFLTVCFIAGVANGFVLEFKGQPILASDILAITTAAEVAGGYDYNITNEMACSFILLEVFLCALTLLPKAKVTKFAALPNIAISGLCALTLFTWYDTTDIHEEYDCTVDAWGSWQSYEEQGALLCILQRVQEFTPQAPDWYTAEEAEKRFFETAEPYIASEEGRDDGYVAPSIVAIMNETFADLSDYAAIDPSYEGPRRFREFCEEALLSGDVYVSALGGGTCNSEFEFLTGASAGLLGPGIYPYMLYDMKDMDNIVEYLGDLGYGTTAIHPAEPNNWRRNIVYEQLGFDTFYDIHSMSDAETLRDLVVDAETYDIVLDILRSADSPQFIFDVTIANHGGYSLDDIPVDERVHVMANDDDNGEIDAYASLIERSDREFADFLDELDKLEEPVVVCMFGDHQASFADRLAEESTGTALEDMTLAQSQMRFSTPYIIWTNSDEIRQAYGTGNKEDMGLSYLPANLLEASGITINQHFAYLLGIQEKLPAVNLNGYMDSEGIWRWHNEDSVSGDAYWELKIVQYNQLFDT